MRSIGWKITGSFAVVLLLLLLIGLLALFNIRQMNANEQWVIHTHLVIENIEGVISLLKDMETGERGFVITGQPDYLDPYHAANSQIGPRLDTLRSLTRDNPVQQASLARLSRLVAAKLADMRDIIALRQGAGGFRAASAQVRQNRGKLLMDEIRAVGTAMEQTEQSLLVRRTRDAQASLRVTIATILVGVPLAFVVVGVLAFFLTRSIALPLARLSAAAEQIAAGDTARGIPLESRRDEIGVLQQSFRDMQRHIAERTAALEASNEELRRSEERFRLMVESVKDYAIILLDPHGLITSWNVGAERIKGYRADEILGKSFMLFYTPEALAADKPREELAQALANGRFEEEGWRMRKDGSRFWANVVINPLYRPDGSLFGYVKVTRDISERRRADEQMRALNADLLRRTAALEESNKELEAFSYSVAHDLRAPLRAMAGFSKFLLEQSAARLDARGQDYLTRIAAAAQRMGRLIDDLLYLAQIGRVTFTRVPVDLSAEAAEIVAELRHRDPEHTVAVEITPGMVARGDQALLRIALTNLLDNAWKFTRGRPGARIAVGVRPGDGARVFYVRDNGAGFAMAYAEKLFTPFQRLHTEAEFPGIGIGLAIVQRIIARHGGRVWAEGAEGQGATFYFTLDDTP